MEKLEQKYRLKTLHSFTAKTMNEGERDLFYLLRKCIGKNGKLTYTSYLRCKHISWSTEAIRLRVKLIFILLLESYLTEIFFWKSEELKI